MAKTHETLHEEDAAYDQQARHVMERVLPRSSNCIDVGAHAGRFLHGMLRIAPAGRRVAFELLPSMYARLVACFGACSNVTLDDAARRDRAGHFSFPHVVTTPGCSGLSRRRCDRPEERVEEILARTDLTDNPIPRETPIHFVESDVDGGELQVLAGGAHRLRILMERPLRHSPPLDRKAFAEQSDRVLNFYFLPQP